MLYCIASSHNFDTTYTWKIAFGTVGINSPVLYAKLPGVYQCTVRNGISEATSKQMVITEGTFWCKIVIYMS